MGLLTERDLWGSLDATYSHPKAQGRAFSLFQQGVMMEPPTNTMARGATAYTPQHSHP